MGTVGESAGGTGGPGVASSSFAMSADEYETATSDSAPVESKETSASDTAPDESTATSDSAPVDSKGAGSALTRDQLAALGISANGVEGMTDQDYARLRYEAEKSGDPLGDGDLRSLFGVATTPAEDA